MTMDGAIVADYITTGTLMGDRVKGGTFEIGGAGLAKDGKILVKNAQGTTLITIDKNGMTFSNGEKIAYSDISGTPNSVVSTHELYYKATTNDWATSPTAWITANDNTLTDQWITRKPASYDNMVRCFTCTQYKRVDGTFYNSAIDEYIAKGFSTKITKDTITTAYVNALNITAKYISTSELMATGVATIAGWKLSSNAIVSFDNTTYENSLKYCVMRRYTGNSNEAAVGIFTRNSTDENYVCQVAFRWDGSLISSDRLNVYAANSNYGMYVHGALAVSGKLHMEGGIIEGFNGISGAGEIYTSGNISGAVTNGRSGLNCTGGGLYVAGNAYVEGGLGCGGTKPRIVKTKTYGYRQMNAYETATPYFGDIGEGVTNENGECIIYFDDIFAETVDLSCNYQVFLQKYGKGDIWVEKREKDHFVVKSDCANLSFGFEIKAVQLDYETVRLDTPDYDMLEIIQKQYAE